MGGQLSEKVDVYSFGLVTLEIVSGRRAIQTEAGDLERTHILQWAWALYDRKQVPEMVDSRILMEEDQEGEKLKVEIQRAVQVALLCTQAKPHVRPSMSEVCRTLRNQSTVADLPSHLASSPWAFSQPPPLIRIDTINNNFCFRGHVRSSHSSDEYTGLLLSYIRMHMWYI